MQLNAVTILKRTNEYNQKIISKKWPQNGPLSCFDRDNFHFLYIYNSWQCLEEFNYESEALEKMSTNHCRALLHPDSSHPT